MLRNFEASSLDRPSVVCVKSFVPKEKKSACSAIDEEFNAALGNSIIVPIVKSKVKFNSSSN